MLQINQSWEKRAMMMKIAPALTAALFVAHMGTCAQADELTNARQLSPNQSIAFRVDAKAVLSYFTSEDKMCKAVMWVAAPPTWQDRVATFATSKYEADIPNGKSGRFVPVPGRTFAFECQSEAQIMIVRPLRPESDREH
jgi:hypothetical protein